jgi:hypothetical protein
MGSLYKRRQRDGSLGGPWWVKYYRGVLPVRESTGTRDLKAARDFMKRREGDLARGLPVSPRLDRIPYEALSRDLVRFYTRTGKRKLDEVEDRLAYLDRFFQGVLAVELTSSRINEYVDWRLQSIMPGYGRPPSKRTINLELALLKRMLRLALRHGRLAAVPYIEMLSEPPPRQGFFEDKALRGVQRRLPADLQVVVSRRPMAGARRLRSCRSGGATTWISEPGRYASIPGWRRTTRGVWWS